MRFRWRFGTKYIIFHVVVFFILSLYCFIEMERRDKSHTNRIADAYVCVSLNVCPLANKLINILHGVVAHDIAFQWRFRMYNYNDVSFFPHFSQATNRKCKKNQRERASDCIVYTTTGKEYAQTFLNVCV